MNYHLTGTLSAALFFLTIYGFWIQLRVIHQRKASNSGWININHRPTAVLSLNQLTAAFLAFYGFFVYGFSIARFNHYLVWPRLAACFLVLLILVEIARDRLTKRAILISIGCGLALLAALLLLITETQFRVQSEVFSKYLILVTTVILVQGSFHQILIIRRSGDTGALAIRTQQLILVKDLSTVAFGFAMGTGIGWPLILMCGTNSVLKVLTLWHFRWVRIKG